MSIRRVNISGMEPKPSVIYLAHRGSNYATGLGFAGHSHMMTLLDRDSAPWFTHCQGCEFNKIYQRTGNSQVGCPGGIRYLMSQDYSDTTRLQTGSRIVTETHRCRKIIRGDFSFEPYAEAPFLVHLPDYILINRYGYDRDTYNLRAYLAKPDAESIDDLYKGIAFIFGNVNEYGSVCLGSSGNDLTWYDWPEIQNAFLNFSRNNDWTEYWRSSRNPELQTLVDYAARMNVEGAGFVNKFQSSYRKDWRKTVLQYDYTWTNQWVFPYQDNYKEILFATLSEKFSIQLTDNTEIPLEQIVGNQTNVNV